MAGAFYAQYFLFVDASIAFGAVDFHRGPCWRPSLAGSARCSVRWSARWRCISWASSRAAIAGRMPGVDLALFGALLILSVALARDGLQGLAASFLRKWRARPA